jgi:hypothetical protein
MEKQLKKAGRKPKNLKDKVQSKGVYLTSREWSLIIKKYGSPTKAMREAALVQCE